MHVRAYLAALAGCLAAACATAPAPEPSPWVRPDALRSCLALRIPPELVRDRAGARIDISMELAVLPSGRIESASVVSEPDNAALDTFLAEELVALPCAPFAPVQARYTYPVSLRLQLDVKP